MHSILFLNFSDPRSCDQTASVHRCLVSSVSLACDVCTWEILITVPFFDDEIPEEIKYNEKIKLIGCDTRNKRLKPNAMSVCRFWKDHYKKLKNLQNIYTIVVYSSLAACTYKTGTELAAIFKSQLIVVAIDGSKKSEWQKTHDTFIYAVGPIVQRELGGNSELLIPWNAIDDTAHSTQSPAHSTQSDCINIVTFWPLCYLTTCPLDEGSKHYASFHEAVKAVGKLCKQHFDVKGRNILYWCIVDAEQQDKIHKFIRENCGFSGINLEFMEFKCDKLEYFLRPYSLCLAPAEDSMLDMNIMQVSIVN